MKISITHTLLIASLFIGALCTGCVSHNKKDTRLSDAELTVVTNRINELKSKFNATPDSITQAIRYIPKWDSAGSTHALLQSKMVMYINDDGSYQFISAYIGEREIDYDRIKFRIDDTLYATARLDSINKRLRKDQFLESYHLERLVFDKTNDGGIPEKIFHSHGPVLAVFCANEEQLSETILSDKVVQDIKDGYELSQLLKLYTVQKKLQTSQQH